MADDGHEFLGGTCEVRCQPVCHIGWSATPRPGRRGRCEADLAGQSESTVGVTPRPHRRGRREGLIAQTLALHLMPSAGPL